MKKVIREDGFVLLISIVIMYLAFRTAVGWEWNFIAAALFALVAGVAGGLLTQVISMIVASKRDPAPGQERGAVAARSPNDRTDGTEETSGKDEAASGTGADESGPRGPVHRSEEYRSSLEDPD